jgi:hypothetical protein
MKTQQEVIANAVINNITVQGKFGANEYNVCDLFKQSLDTLDSFYAHLSDIAEKQTRKSLKDKKASSSVTEKLELIETVYEIVKARAEQSRIDLEAKNKAIKELTLLEKAKESQEIAEINSLTKEQLAERIASAKARL